MLSWPTLSAIATAENPRSIRCEMCECLRSWILIFFTPDNLHPRSISWWRKLFVTRKILSVGVWSYNIAKYSCISSARNFGNLIVLLLLGVFGVVITSCPCSRWYDLFILTVFFSKSKSSIVSASPNSCRCQDFFLYQSVLPARDTLHHPA